MQKVSSTVDYVTVLTYRIPNSRHARIYRSITSPFTSPSPWMPSNWGLLWILQDPNARERKLHSHGSRFPLSLADARVSPFCPFSPLSPSWPNCEARVNEKIERQNLFAVVRNEWRINSRRKRHADGRILRLARLQRLKRHIGGRRSPCGFSLKFIGENETTACERGVHFI